MEFEIRQAKESDVPQIVEVKRSVWPEEVVNPDYVAGVVRNPDHLTLVAGDENKVVGFVDGFMTTSSGGIRRWEVDLLAVHPTHQGQGIATQLILATTNAGRVAGASVARALVGVENMASQRTFARCNYFKNPEMHALYVGFAGPDAAPLPDAHFVRVSTMNYAGVWVEGGLSLQSLAAAQAMCAQHNWDVAGVVLPMSQHSGIQAAQESGYSLIGHHEWWQLDLRKA